MSASNGDASGGGGRCDGLGPSGRRHVFPGVQCVLPTVSETSTSARKLCTRWGGGAGGAKREERGPQEAREGGRGGEGSGAWASRVARQSSGNYALLSQEWCYRRMFLRTCPSIQRTSAAQARKEEQGTERRGGNWGENANERAGRRILSRLRLGGSAVDKLARSSKVKGCIGGGDLRLHVRRHKERAKGMGDMGPSPHFSRGFIPVSSPIPSRALAGRERSVWCVGAPQRARKQSLTGLQRKASLRLRRGSSVS